MRKYALIAAIAALALAVPLSFGSSHREAPLISQDPTGDNTDVYAFTAADTPNKLTIVANWIPFEDPAGGPNFYRFDDSARYYLNIDNTGDGVADVRYLFDFNTKVRNKNSFLYALGGEVTSLRDPDLNVLQTYKLTREKLRNGRIVNTKVLGKGLPTPPNNVGPKTIPNYEPLADAAVRSLNGGVKVFAGQRDDPFFASLGRIFDTINLTGAGLGNMGGGVDDLAGYAVHSTILQVPEGQLTRNHKPVAGPDARNAVVGVWSTTERRTLKVAGGGAGPYRQISRLANPLVNEVIIPLGQKDRFNRTTPDKDAANYGKYVLSPELAKVLNALFDVGAPENNRTDIVQAVLQGVPGLNAFPGKAAKNATDTIKINLGTPPTASPSRLGVLGGDNAGYPNGRRLTDDVVDIDLQVVAGALKGHMVPLGDGVDQNNVPFLDHFPYVASPRPGANPAAGYGSQLKTSGNGNGGADTLLVSNEAGGEGPAVSAAGSLDRDQSGSSAVVWVLIAAGAAVLLTIGVAAGRSGSRS
jgi:uncharacterized protein DUF4331